MKPHKRLPRKLSSHSAYWQGFLDGSKEEREAWTEEQIYAHYARLSEWYAQALALQCEMATVPAAVPGQ